MSIEAQFSTMRYPSLRSTAQGERDDTARAGGYAAGYAAGLRAAEVEVAARIAAQALDARTVPVLAEAQAAIEHGALQLAEALVGREFGEAGSAARSAVHRALSGVDTALVQTVRMNPVDLQTLASLDLVPSGVDFTADPRLARGDAVTEFADGYLDARISAALVRARAALEEARP
jgi:flagellar assembly protein FliH